MDTLWDASPADPPRESHPGGCNLSADLPALSPNREHVSAAPRTPSLYSFLHCSPIIQRKERPAAATESRPCENAAPATAASSSPSTPPPLEIPVSGIETEASSVLSISSPSRSQQSPFDSSLPSPLVPEIAAHYADGMQHPPDRFDDGGDYLGALDFVAESMENTGAGGGKPLPSPSPGGARDGIRRAGSAFGSSANTTTLGGGLSPLEEPRQSVCRHGQIGAFSTYQRFVPGSRPLVSDNWRSKAGTDDASKPEPSPLAMGAGNAGAGNDNSNAASASPITPGGGGSRATGSYASPHGHARAQSRSAVLGTPSRSPLAAPANQNLAGFGRAAVQAGPSQTLGEGAVAGRGGFGAAASPLSAAGYSHAGTGAGITGTPNNIPAGTTADNPPTTPSSRGRMGLDDSGLAEHMSLLSMDNAGNADTNAGDVVLAEQMTRLNIRDNAPSTAAAAAAAADVTILHAQLAPDTLGYCFVRPDGARTRLVPVDMLPVALRGIPARETGDADTVARLVELPVPRGIDAAGRSSNLHRLVLDGSQLQIHASHSPPNGTTTDNVHQQQQQPPPPPKRMKVYCDKWVHEGVCAFTQQGCKFKHEMPLDAATQHALGLFHGLPAWYRKQQGELARVLGPAPPSLSALPPAPQNQNQHHGQQQQGGGGGGGLSASIHAAAYRSAAAAGGRFERWGVGQSPFAVGGAQQSQNYFPHHPGGQHQTVNSRACLPPASRQTRHRPQLSQSWRFAGAVHAAAPGQDDEDDQQQQQQQQHGSGKGLLHGFDGVGGRDLVPFRFGLGAGGRNERAVGSGGCGGDGGAAPRSSAAAPGWDHLSARAAQHHALQQQQGGAQPGFGGARAFSAFPPSQFGPIAPPRLQQIQQHLGPGMMTPLTERTGEDGNGALASCTLDN